MSYMLFRRFSTFRQYARSIGFQESSAPGCRKRLVWPRAVVSRQFRIVSPLPTSTPTTTMPRERWISNTVPSQSRGRFEASPAFPGKGIFICLTWEVPRRKVSKKGDRLDAGQQVDQKHERHDEIRDLILGGIDDRVI